MLITLRHWCINTRKGTGRKRTVVLYVIRSEQTQVGNLLVCMLCPTSIRIVSIHVDVADNSADQVTARAKFVFTLDVNLRVQVVK